MARSRPIDTAGQKGFKVLVLDEVDRISKEAQHSLRRTMEKYSAACRLVLCCNNVSKVCGDNLTSNVGQGIDGVPPSMYVHKQAVRPWDVISFRVLTADAVLSMEACFMSSARLDICVSSAGD